MSRSDKTITLNSILFGASVGLLSAAGIHYYKKWKRQSKQSAAPAVEKEWHRIGVISKLFIYPLKSGHRIQLDYGFCTTEGLQMEYNVRDRSFIIYDPEKNQFRTARDYPKFINIRIEPRTENIFSIGATSKPTIQIKLSNFATEPTIITLHKEEKTYIKDCGDDAAEWISQYILDQNTGLRLGFYDKSKKRDVTHTHAEHLEQYKNFGNAALGLQSDFTSYLIINQASVDDLSLRVKTDDISVLNFRPNIVVTPDDGVPYSEDKWENVKIGNAEFYYVKPCTRCVFTTIDPVRAEKSKSNEPLKTLRGYRTLETIITDAKIEKSLTVMGVNVGLNVEGVIAVGDPVYVQLF